MKNRGPLRNTSNIVNLFLLVDLSSTFLLSCHIARERRGVVLTLKYGSDPFFRFTLVGIYCAKQCFMEKVVHHTLWKNLLM